MLKAFILACSIVSYAFSASCGDGTWTVAYNGGQCDKSGSVYTMKCPSKNDPGKCGMRLDGKARLGVGTYGATFKSVTGEGTNTAFYLYSYGRHNDQSSAWNEIDIEILGKQISGGKTKVWTNVWTGFKNQHGKLVTVNWDASKGYHTYKIKIDNKNIYWIFDGKTVRTFGYTQYCDLVETIANKDFQAEMSLWGWHSGAWPDMGNMWNNNAAFPQNAYFKNVQISQSSGAKPSCGSGGSGGSCGSGKIKVTTENVNTNWFAARLSNIPSGISITKVEFRSNSGWKTAGKASWNNQVYEVHGQKWYAPVDVRLKTNRGRTITSHDIIKSISGGASGCMTQNAAFTAEDEAGNTSISGVGIAAIVLLCSLCIIGLIIGGICFYKKRKGVKDVNDKSIDDMKELNDENDTPVNDGSNDKIGYDMSPISTNDTGIIGDDNGEQEEIEIELDVTVNEEEQH